MLGAQKRTRTRAHRDHNSLGNILVDLGYCTEHDIKMTIAKQCNGNSLQPLGQLLVNAEIITQDQLDHALLRQRVLRGKEDPASLKRFGTSRRIEAFNEIADRFKDVAKTSTLLAEKTRG